MVSVVGLVHQPGLVTLAPESRIADAVTAAGGPLSGADTLGLNLARHVTDGEQVVVGIAMPAGKPPVLGSSAGAGPAAPAPATTGTKPAGPVDLNTATVEQLDALPGLGPVRAAAIVAWRTNNGKVHQRRPTGRGRRDRPGTAGEAAAVGAGLSRARRFGPPAGSLRAGRVGGDCCGNHLVLRADDRERMCRPCSGLGAGRVAPGGRYPMLLAFHAGVVGAAVVGAGFGLAAGLRSDATLHHPLSQRFGDTAWMTAAADESPLRGGGRLMFRPDSCALRTGRWLVRSQCSPQPGTSPN